MISIYEDYAQFAKVEDIYVADGKIVFEVKLYETIAYCTHFHAYQVKKTSSSQIVNISDFITPYPLLIRHINHSIKYVAVLRHHICGCIS